MRILNNRLFDVINYLKSAPYHAVEHKISYGLQLKLPCGVLCNLHFRERPDVETFSFTMQNEDHAPDVAAMIWQVMGSLSVD